MKVLILFCITAVVLADEDGRYVPDRSGEYVPDYSGQYIPDDSGRYNDDGTGRYAGQKDGYFGGRGLNDGINNGNLIGSGTNPALVQIKSNVVRPSTPPPQPKPQTIDYNVRSNNYQDGKWKIIRQLSDIDTDGYHWEYETENKIIAEESGKLHNKGTDAEAIRAKGFFQYTGPNNVVYSITYTADENGFVPVGDHIPTPPPIPAAIVRALEYNRVNDKL